MRLDDLLRLVPAARELDDEVECLAQLRHDRWVAETEELGGAWMRWPLSGPRIWDLWSGEPTDDDDTAGSRAGSIVGSAEDDVLPRADELQVLALLADRLGARPIE